MRKEYGKFRKKLSQWKVFSILSCLLVLISVHSYALQDRIVTGKVQSLEENEALPGVSIIIKGTNIGTVTDIDGNFSLSVPSGNNTLVFSFIGYLTKEISIGIESNYNIFLESDTKALGEVIVTGYAIQRAEEITGAIETLNVKDLPNAPVATVGQKLQGKLAGVRVTQTSGRPGQGLNFQIRGAFSFTGGSQPLYVVDGMPIEGDISFISPNEIENITVLKDPAAASLYGSRAANGVVLIQTNKTEFNRETQISFDSYYGFENIPQGRRLEMMNAREYAQFQKEIAELNGRPVNPAFQNPDQLGTGTDWFDAITRTGAIQSYNFGISQGSEKFATSASLGYFNQEGVVVGTSFERFSFRINSRFKPNEKLNIGLNFAPTLTKNTNFNTDGWPYVTENIVSSALITTPLANPFNPDGSLSLIATDPATFGNPNWLRVAKEKVFEDDDFQLLSNLSIDYEIAKGLTAKTTGNFQIGNRNIFEFNPSTIGVLFIPPPRIPFGSNNNVRFTNWLNENTLNYAREINEHKFDALVGFTAQKARADGLTVFGNNFPDDKVRTLNAAGILLVDSSVEEWTLLSYLARVNYQFKDKYLFTASIRRDGSSRFGENNRWGNFPAVSAGWIISKEDFWNENAINFFKIRASYGLTGNFQIGNYSHRSTIGEVFYPFANVPTAGRIPNNLGDQRLGWENNRQFNLGADINLWNDRIQLAYNYYVRNTDNLLFDVEVPVSSGFNSIQTNIGELKFWGHEIAAQAAVINKSNFKWNTNFNVSFDRNKVVSLGNQTNMLPSGILLYQFRSHMSIVGQPITQFYGAIQDGVYVDQQDFDNSPKHPSSQVGTVKFRDLNGDGIISFPEDMTIIGNPWPDFVYGFTNQFSYRNFTLSMAILGSFGNDILAFYENWAANLDGVFNVLRDVNDRWKSPENPGAGKFGSVQQGTTFLERDRWNSRFIKDGSYLSLNNLTIGYNLPMSGNSTIKRLYLYSSIQNALFITNYPGTNPEVNTQRFGSTAANQSSIGNVPGVDENSYPIPRTVSFGISVGF